MMTEIARAVSAEFLKLRRTLALRLALVAPLAVVGLQSFVSSQQPDTPRPGATPLLGLVQGGLFLWTLIVLPLYAGLAAALVAAVDHQDDHWKHLFALPIRRWSIFVAKWTAVIALVLISFLSLAAGLLILTSVLRVIHPAWPAYPGLVRLAIVRMAQAFFAAWLLVSIQLWVSLRWRSFTVGLGVAIVAFLFLLGLAARGGNRRSVARVFPWGLPVTAIARIVESTPNRGTAALYGSAGGVLVGLAGCWTLSRREWR
ncbi:MAG: ABC transporter permease [Vicinamibacterales bacterium]